MRSKIVKWLYWLITGGVVLTGCGAPNALPREFVNVLDKTVDTMREQGVLKEFIADADAEIIEPGFEGGVAVVYKAYGKLTGTAGHIGIRSKGEGRGTPTSQPIVPSDSKIPSVMDEAKKIGDVKKSLN